MINRASSCLPVNSNKPLRDINVSLPQFLIYPTAKCGNPADSVKHSCSFFPSTSFTFGFGGSKLGDKSGSCADFITPPTCTETKDSNLVKSVPSFMKLEHF